MKKILLLLSLVTFYFANAQTPNYAWGRMFGNNQNLYVYDNATDANGNVYLTGEYSGTVDFDPGAGTSNQTANATGGRDIFILKLDASGALSWVKTYGGTGIDFGQRIAVDNSGNIYVGGRFQNAVTFTGFGGFSSNGGYDGFLLKMDTAGTLQWVLDLSGGGTEGFLGITTDASGNLYTAGFFNTASATLGGLNSTFTTLTRAGASANYDFFVAKYNANGERMWSNTTGAGYDEIPYGIALTDDDKVVTVGSFIGTSVDFNPGAASNLLYSNSNSTSTGFIQVLEAGNGNFSWARSLGSSSNDTVLDVASANNNIYVTGYFAGPQADFNTTGSGGGDILNRTGSIDSFVAKYTSTSTFVWVKQIRGTTGSDNRGSSIAVKGNPERVYTTGTFTSLVYLNPTSSASISSFGAKDSYIASYDDAGAYLWGGSVKSMDNDDAWGISVDDNYNVYMSGYSASGNFAINPFSNSTVPNNSTTGNDVYVIKLEQPNACIVTIPDANFKNYLVNNTAINTNGDTEIQCGEASAFTGTIDCSSSSISDMTGIEAFTSLTSLLCHNNSIGTLNVSTLTALTNLECFQNSLTTIDLSNNTALTTLNIRYNQLTSLNVSNNANLTYIGCHYNQLTSLDVSNNTQLTELYCNDNNLSTLNIKNTNNSNLIGFYANNNPSLTCIQIDDAFTPPSNGTWVKDVTASYSDNCAALSSDEFEITTPISVYPNPVQNRVTILSKKELAKIELYTLSGQKIPMNVIDNNMDMSGLSAGLYVLQVITIDGDAIVKKIIKQ
ncbi:MAG: hypothetical protein CMP76_10905 [Flavobacterium sp.]|uniref:T9SS type A sorting domain-containing protein n=1 Tax=Flavobacterium sp. TaxID=239 RepID=UPI000C5E69DC|nr:T9SS type A sorting domain-containing protein [Flavobacterium sp.]MBF03793.1 hypothetical protein [Flavobacterium sp.]